MVYRLSRRTFGPVTVSPPEVTQSVRNVCSPSFALHQFVVCVAVWPGCTVTEMPAVDTWLPLKKLTRWVKVTALVLLFRTFWSHLQRYGVVESQPEMLNEGCSVTGFGDAVMLTPPGVGAGAGDGEGDGVGLGLGVGVGVGSGDVGEVLPHATANNRAARQTRRTEYARIGLSDFIAMDSPLLAKNSASSTRSLASKTGADISAGRRRGVSGRKRRPVGSMDEKGPGR